MTINEYNELQIGMTVQIVAAGRDRGKICKIIKITDQINVIQHPYVRNGLDFIERGLDYEYRKVGIILTLELVDPNAIFLAQGFIGKRQRTIKSWVALKRID